MRLGNVLSTFKTTSFDMTHQTDGNGWHVDFISPKDGGGWDNYVKVALQEGLEEYFKDGKDKLGEEPTGMDLLVSGTVPPGSGLSSSAAFVVGSVIMFLVADNLTSGVSKGDIVQMAMNSEHRMGLRTGGMDVSTPISPSPTSLLLMTLADCSKPHQLCVSKTPYCIYPSSPRCIPFLYPFRLHWQWSLPTL